MSYLDNARRFKNFEPSWDYKKQLQYVSETHDWGDEEMQKLLFLDIQKKISNSTPSFIELGSGGTDSSVYSLLFEKYHNYECTIINTEPRKELLDLIKSEWMPNHLKNAILYHGYNGSGNGLDNKEIIPKLKISDIMKECNLEKVDILHMDIQGDEVVVLEEMEYDNTIRKIRFFFISTHSLSIHEKCLEIINRNLKTLYYFSDPYSGGYGDGLIVFENLDF